MHPLDIEANAKKISENQSRNRKYSAVFRLFFIISCFLGILIGYMLFAGASPMGFYVIYYPTGFLILGLGICVVCYFRLKFKYRETNTLKILFMAYNPGSGGGEGFIGGGTGGDGGGDGGC